jgi:predicted transcriptional regulator
MTALLEKALEALRKLPPDAQDAYARLLLDALDDGNPIYELDDEERAAIERSRAEACRGEFVPEAEIEAFWKKLGI